MKHILTTRKSADFPILLSPYDFSPANSTVVRYVRVLGNKSESFAITYGVTIIVAKTITQDKAVRVKVG